MRILIVLLASLSAACASLIPPTADSPYTLPGGFMVVAGPAGCGTMTELLHRDGMRLTLTGTRVQDGSPCGALLVSWAKVVMAEGRYISEVRNTKRAYEVSSAQMRGGTSYDQRQDSIDLAAITAALKYRIVPSLIMESSPHIVSKKGKTLSMPPPAGETITVQLPGVPPRTITVDVH